MEFRLTCSARFVDEEEAVRLRARGFKVADQPKYMAEQWYYYVSETESSIKPDIVTLEDLLAFQMLCCHPLIINAAGGRPEIEIYNGYRE